MTVCNDEYMSLCN